MNTATRPAVPLDRDRSRTGGTKAESSAGSAIHRCLTEFVVSMGDLCSLTQEQMDVLSIDRETKKLADGWIMRQPWDIDQSGYIYRRQTREEAKALRETSAFSAQLAYQLWWHKQIGEWHDTPTFPPQLVHASPVTGGRR